MNESKLVKILVSVRYYYRGDKVFQHFVMQNAKKYFKSQQYLLYYKIQKKIKSLSLSNLDGFEFLNKREESDRIVLEFSFKKKIRFLGTIFSVAEFVPPNPGCRYCRYREGNETEFFNCSFQNNKVMTREIIRCKYFRQEEN